MAVSKLEMTEMHDKSVDIQQRVFISNGLLSDWPLVTGHP